MSARTVPHRVLSCGRGSPRCPGPPSPYWSLGSSDIGRPQVHACPRTYLNRHGMSTRPGHTGMEMHRHARSMLTRNHAVRSCKHIDAWGPGSATCHRRGTDTMGTVALRGVTRQERTQPRGRGKGQRGGAGLWPGAGCGQLQGLGGVGQGHRGQESLWSEVSWAARGGRRERRQRPREGRGRAEGTCHGSAGEQGHRSEVCACLNTRVSVCANVWV